MSEQGYAIKDQYAVHFITFAVVQWIDVFSRKEYADIVIESLRFCQKNKGLKVHAWCIMSNHLHLIVSTIEPNRLSDVLRDFKKFTSNQIIKAISENSKESRKGWMLWIFKKAGERNKRNEEYQFWQQENHPVQCDTNNIIESKLKYLHENPLRAGLVRYEQNYIYSSGIDYYTDEKGLIEIDFV
ncbi:REP-associated tyrosine transposase [Rubrolithibacter danxiaensis]|uniref:REP-associated tyrosine transposase n=1 Tax=Rubrolithibacter danxiaensis TaxID=3390805 RepID=UPI003BF849B9